MRRYSFFLLILCLLAACGDDARIATVLNRADSLMNSRPDSALTLLDSALHTGDASDRQTARLRLRRLNAINKLDTVFTEAHVAQASELVTHFDRHGTPNERMLAHYLLGRTYADAGQAPQAIQSYLEAAECADTTSVDCDYKTLGCVFSQMAQLYHKQLLLSFEIETRKKARHFALLGKDTLNAIYDYKAIASAYILMNKKDSAEYIIKEAISQYKKYNRDQDILQTSLLLMYLYVEDPARLQEAKSLMDEFESHYEPFVKNQQLPPSKRQYYYYKGRFYDGIGKLDSAEYYYRKVSRSKMSFSQKNPMYLGLLSVFRKRHNADSIAKYSMLYCEANDSSIAIKDQHLTAQLTASYRYNTIQRLALENEKTANRFRIILAISIIFFIVLVILISYFINRYKNKQRELREEQIKKHLQEVNSLKLEFADATESYKENLHELQLLEESRKKVISIIRDELHGLNKEKDNYKKKYTELKLLKDRISEEYEKSIEVFRKENCELNEKIETLKQQDGISEHIKG